MLGGLSFGLEKEILDVGQMIRGNLILGHEPVQYSPFKGKLLIW